MKKNCLLCGIEYECRPARAHISKFCSVRHRCDWEKIHGRIRLTKEEKKTRKKEPKKTYVCQACGKKFQASKYKSRKYCDLECTGKDVGKLPTNSWRKGVSKDDPREIDRAKKYSETMKKKYASGELKPWNKGLTVETDKRMAKMVEIQKEWRNTEGPEKESWKASMSRGQVRAWSDGKYPFNFTRPEVLTWEYLESFGFIVKPFAERSDDDPHNIWYHQYNFFDAFVPDFACPDKELLIEVHGCAYHGHSMDECLTPKPSYVSNKAAQTNLKRDKKKYSMYRRKNWDYVVLWECYINENNFAALNERL